MDQGERRISALIQSAKVETESPLPSLAEVREMAKKFLIKARDGS